MKKIFYIMFLVLVTSSILSLLLISIATFFEEITSGILFAPLIFLIGYAPFLSAFLVGLYVYKKYYNLTISEALWTGFIAVIMIPITRALFSYVSLIVEAPSESTMILPDIFLYVLMIPIALVTGGMHTLIYLSTFLLKVLQVSLGLLIAVSLSKKLRAKSAQRIK